MSFDVDVSGSMSDEDLKEGFAVINSVCKHSDLTYILFDTKIKDVYKKYRNVKNDIHIKGRGGTSFDCVIRYGEKEKCDGLVVFSDMCAPEPPKPKRLRVLWLGHEKGDQPPVSWGMRAELNRFE